MVQPMFRKLHLTTITITVLMLLPTFAQAEAISNTKAALHATNTAQNSMLQIGIAALEEGDLQTALSTLEQAVLITPNMVESHFWLGRARLEAGQPAAAVESLRRAEKLFGGFDQRITYELGLALMRSGDLNSARLRFEAVIKTNPAAPLPKLNLGWILMQEDQGGKALELFESVTVEHPDNDLAHYYAGRVHEGNARFGEAVAAYERALTLSPYLLQALVSLGKLEMARGDLARARILFERSIVHHPQVADAHLQLGLLELREGDLDAAVNELERAVTLDPANETTRYHLGSVYARVGRFAESQLAFEKFDNTRTDAVGAERTVRRSRAESHAEFLVRRAEQDIEAGNWEAAQATLAESIALEPMNPEALKSLSMALHQYAQILLAERSFSRAVEVLETAVNLWASEIKTWELLVTAYRAVGDAAGTQRALERVRALR